MMEYFCTCGRGTESFLVTELEKTFSLKKVLKKDGKVWFAILESDEDEEHLLGTSVHKQSTLQRSHYLNPDLKNSDVVQQLLGLKSCERLFVSVLYDCKISLNTHEQAVRQIKAMLYKVLVSDWLKHLQAWRVLTRSEDCGRDVRVSTIETKESRNERLIEQSSKRAVDDFDNYPRAKRERTEEQFDNSADAPVLFRVSAKCSGVASRLFTPQSLSSLIGPIISRVTGWKIDLRRPLLEISIQLNHQGFTVGLPVSGPPLSKRQYLKHAGLRTTIASIMSSLADIQSGMTILDPMCGEGTILIEAVKIYPDCLYIGCDVDLTQCQKAMDNIMFSNETKRVQVINASISCLPLHSLMFDVVLCDIPFGMKHGTIEGSKLLYPAIISTINRVLKSGGKAVLLVGAQLKDALLEIVDSQSVNVNADEQNCSLSIVALPLKEEPKHDKQFVENEMCSRWIKHLVHYVKLGETDAYICVFQKQ